MKQNLKTDKIKKALRKIVYDDPNTSSVAKELAAFFNIPLSEERLADCSIKSFDLDSLSVEIVDSLTSTIYQAEYTDDLAMFDYKSDEKEFLKVQVILDNEGSFLDRYYDCNKQLLVEDMHIFNGDDEINLIRKHNDKYGYTNYLEELDIWFKKDINSGRTNAHNSNDDFGESVVKTHKEYVYSFDNFPKRRDLDEESRYVVIDYTGGGITTGVHNLWLVNEGLNLTGVCIQSTNNLDKKRLPLGMYRESFEGFSDSNVISLLAFEGVDDVKKQLEIKKYPFIISMLYHKIDENNNDILVREITLPSQSAGVIEIDEVSDIVKRLNTEFNDDKFITLASREIDEFKKEINVPWVEEDRLFSARSLINKKTDDIISLVTSRKQDCFSDIDQRMNDSFHIDEAIKRNNQPGQQLKKKVGIS